MELHLLFPQFSAAMASESQVCIASAERILQAHPHDKVLMVAENAQLSGCFRVIFTQKIVEEMIPNLICAYFFIEWVVRFNHQLQGVPLTKKMEL